MVKYPSGDDLMDGVFISYSHKDVDAVEKIVEILRNTCKKEVWFDRNLRGGENYFSVIANEILQNDFFVFIVSDHSVNSEWCIRELQFAASESKKIIAIWLDNITIPAGVRLVIQNTHYINRYSTTNSLFSDALMLAFSGSSAIASRSAASNDDDVIPSLNKYFLVPEEMQKLNELLRLEEEARYSVCFLPENAKLLGIAYELGINVAEDTKKALLYYKTGMYFGDADSEYLYASLKNSQEPDAQYIQQMIDAAEKGSVIALTKIGDNYYAGRDGFPVDINKAYDFFEAAAKKAYAEAMYYIAYGYRKGECRAQDLELAYMYNLRALECGFPRAFRQLAFMYEDGAYVEKDPQKAVRMYEEAIKRGDYLSLCYQGYICGEAGDIQKKAELYLKAVEYADEDKIKSGLPYYRAAYIYSKGEGVEQNIVTACYYCLKGAERKNKSSLNWAVDYIKKLPASMREEYLLKAYELKCRDAAYELGRAQIDKAGDDNARLSDKAVMYFSEGALSGDIFCAEELIRNFSFILGKGDRDKDRDEAIKWFRFFFANISDEEKELFRKNNSLATYYYAYAIELDYDPDVGKKDREFVLFNFKKSIEECPKHFDLITHFVVNGYLFPDESGSELPVDVPHAEEVLEMLEENLDKYKEFCGEFTGTFKSTLGEMIKGYNAISECYAKGNFVKKDKIRAQHYKTKALKINQIKLSLH